MMLGHEWYKTTPMTVLTAAMVTQVIKCFMRQYSLAVKSPI